MGRRSERGGCWSPNSYAQGLLLRETREEVGVGRECGVLVTVGLRVRRQRERG